VTQPVCTSNHPKRFDLTLRWITYQWWRKRHFLLSQSLPTTKNAYSVLVIWLSLNSIGDSHRNRNTGDLSVMLSESETHYTNEPRQINRRITSKPLESTTLIGIGMPNGNAFYYAHLNSPDQWPPEIPTLLIHWIQNPPNSGITALFRRQDGVRRYKPYKSRNNIPES
jgi:hypothetical protein